MLYLHTLKDAEPVFKALSAPMRLRILELINENEDMSMADLAAALELTNSAISIHVGKLEEAGLVRIQAVSGKHGIMKLVKPTCNRLIVDLVHSNKKLNRNCYEDEINIGHYINVDPHPTCGLSTSTHIIGELDNPRMFSYTERFQAEILWIGWGSITYNLPNRLTAGQKLTELQISFEISSECPETNDDYPSDIYFYINDVPLGKYISPGDYGARHGILSPEWWSDRLNQYGLLKTLIINDLGTFIDGTYMISETTINDLNIDYNSTINFKFEVPTDTANCGGITLFGSSFGDYRQSIISKLYYSE